MFKVGESRFQPLSRFPCDIQWGSFTRRRVLRYVLAPEFGQGQQEEATRPFTATLLKADCLDQDCTAGQIVKWPGYKARKLILRLFEEWVSNVCIDKDVYTYVNLN